MKTGERLLSAVVDLQHYVKHSHDPATCAACPRWDELQQAAVAAVDALSAADLDAAAYRDRADRSAAKMHAEVERLREELAWLKKHAARLDRGWPPIPDVEETK